MKVKVKAGGDDTRSMENDEQQAKKKNSEKMDIKQLKRHTVGLIKGKEAPTSPQTAPNKYYISRKCEEI